MNRHNSRLASATLAAVMTLAVIAYSQPQNYRAHLAGGNEVPAVQTNAQGEAIFQLNEDGTALSYRLNVANINDVRASHIHLAPEGVNGPVVAFLFGGPTTPGRTQGVLATGTITGADLVGPLAGQPLSALIDAINAGDAYVNVHTDAFPGGEIRGQIK